MGQLPLEGIWYERKRCYFVIGVVDCGYRTRSVYRPNEIAAPRKRRRPLLTMKTCIGVGKTRGNGCHPCSYLICKRSVAQALRQTIEGRRQDVFVSARDRRLLNKVTHRFIRPLEELLCTSLRVFFCHFTLQDFSMPMALWS